MKLYNKNVLKEILPILWSYLFRHWNSSQQNGRGIRFRQGLF